MKNIIENTTSVNGESVMQPSAGPNVQDEPTAESGSTPLAEAAFENPAGSGSAPSFCSTSEVSDKQGCIPERMLECVRDDLMETLLSHGEKSLEYYKALRDALSYIKKWLLPILDRAVAPQSEHQPTGVRGTSRSIQIG